MHRRVDPKCVVKLAEPFLLLVAGIVSGRNPAFFMPKFLPIDALRSQMKLERIGRVRHVLVVFQVDVSVLLVGCMTVVGRQLNLMTTKPLGFRPKDVVVVHNMLKLEKRGVARAYEEALQSYPTVLKASRTWHAYSIRVQRFIDVKSDVAILNDVEILDGDLGLLETLDVRLRSDRVRH